MVLEFGFVKKKYFQAKARASTGSSKNAYSLQRAISVYEIFTGSDRNPESYLERFDAAIDSYFRGDFRAAESMLAGIAEERPGDAAALWYLSRSRECVSSPESAVWDGVEQLISK